MITLPSLRWPHLLLLTLVCLPGTEAIRRTLKLIKSLPYYQQNIFQLDVSTTTKEIKTKNYVRRKYHKEATTTQYLPDGMEKQMIK